MKASSTFIMCLASVILSAVVFLGMAKRPPLLEPGQVAPTFTLPNLTGHQVSFDELRGTVNFVMFWASWCQPCMEEMPEVQAIFEQYKAEGFQVIAVNFREPHTIVQEVADRFGLTFPVLLDLEATAAADYRVLGLPLSFIVDREGIVRERIFGRSLTKDELETRIKHYLHSVHGALQVPLSLSDM